MGPPTVDGTAPAVEPAPDPSSGGDVRRSWWSYGARLALTVVILVGLVTILGNDDLPEVIRSVGPGAFAASVVLNIGASIVLPAVVSLISVRRTGLDLGLRRLIAINFTIRFYTLILPRAAATGVRWVKYRAAGTGGEAAALVVLEKLVQVFVYAGMAAVFVVVESPELGGATGPLLALAVVLMLPSALGLVAVFTEGIDPLLRRLVFLTRIPWLGRAIEVVAAAVVTQRGMRPRQLVALGGWSVVGYGLFVLSAWVIAVDLDVGVSLAALGWIRGLVFLGTLIPITIAGTGVREAGFVGFLSIYDVADATALGFALVLLGVQIVIGAVGGVMELVGWLGRSRAGTPAPAASIIVEEDT